MTLRFDGVLLPAVVTVTDQGGVIFAGTVEPGGTFSFSGTVPGEKFVGDQVSISNAGVPSGTINTSCSAAPYINDVYGSFTIVAATSKLGGVLCCAAEDMETTPPVISGCPGNVSVVTGPAACTATVNWTAPTATDNCGSVTLTSNYNPGDIFPVGTTLVTYTATDDYGNASTCNFNVTVVDDTDPVISGCPANITVSANASCMAVVNWTAPSASDNCAGVTLAGDHSPGDAFPVGITAVTYTATDGSGNTSTCSFNVTVVDDTDPVISGCPANVTVSANASCVAIVNWTAPSASDNCAGVTLAGDHNPGDAFPLGTTTVTYTATDGSGNTSTCSFNVTVVDDTDPVISGCPANVTVSANASCVAIVNWTAPSASDNCAGVTLAGDHNPGDAFPVGITTVTYTATDGAGNTSTCSFNVTVVDDTDPVISGCPANITISANASCMAVVNWTAPSVSDNCAGVTISGDHSPGDAFPVGTTTVTYTATDGSGNTSTCSFNVTVVDDTDPVISGCPANITVSANAACMAVVNWTAPSVSDNCAGVTISGDHNPGDAFPFGTTAVTYTATDGAGNTSTCSFNITVVDDTGPVISGCPGNISVPANASCMAVVNWTAPSASDNCAGVTISGDHSPGDAFPVGTTTVTYTATDGSGNTSTCSFNVTVVDDTDPVINGCPANISVPANASCMAVVNWTAPSASDNCAGVTISGDHNPGDAFPLGITTVTYTATDGSGNTSTCSFNVTVVDDTDPVINGCPANISVPANASCQAIVNWTAPSASDNCAGVTISGDHSPGDAFPVGTTTVTYTATDGSGNTSTCSFNVTVVDDTDPVISGCPANITVSANASCQAIVNWAAPSASDNCAGLTISGDHAPGDAFPLGTTTVTYTATDGSGNTSTCSFNVTVVDDTDPVIGGCPGNISVPANASCVAVVNWTAPSASDNCAGVTISGDHSSGDAFPVGTTTVTYTATDGSGNTSTCSFNVTVVDDTNPVISGCPANISVSANASCMAIVNWTAPSVSDNCAGVTISGDHAPGDAFPLGITTVTYTATDGAGNTSTCSFNVTVVDDTDPVLNNCPSADITISANGSCQGMATWTPPTASDNCAGVTISSDHNPGDMFPVGTTTVTYTATDASGNISTCSFNIVVAEDMAPVFSNCVTSDVTVSANAACQASVNWPEPLATDNCGNVTVTSNYRSGDIFPIGTTQVIYTATDQSNNSVTCSFNVIVTDDTDPTFNNCVTSDVIVSSDGACQATASWTAPTAADNCGAVTLISNHNPGDIFPFGTTVVTYTATDASNNSSTCSFNVVVVDDSNPVLNNCPADITISANGSCEARATWTPPTASDNCTDVTVTSSHQPGDLFPVGTTQVTYTATDGSGNISTCAFNIIVRETTAPVFSHCPADITVASDDACQATLTWSLPVVSDHCGATVLTSDHTPGDVFPLGTTLVTYTATDESDNIATCTFRVVVTDQTAPVISGCPDSDIIVSASESCQAPVHWTPPSASDNCGAVTVTSSHSPGEIFPFGSTQVTYTATDNHGNTSSCHFNVVIRDDVPPLFQDCPGDITVSPDGTCAAVAHWAAPSATDNCGTATITSSHRPGDAFPPGITTVTYTATDVHGNASACEFNVIVSNEIPPVITDCPASISAKANELGEATITWDPPSASVICGDVAWTSSHMPNTVFRIGRTEVVYTATDDFGNSSVCSFDVIIEKQEVEFDVQKLITPDGDGINDTWKLGNIEKFRQNSVIIVDRWGSVIFRASGYDNESIAWSGQNLNGDLLPTGTYFYTIFVRFGHETQEKRGFIELIR